VGHHQSTERIRDHYTLYLIPLSFPELGVQELDVPIVVCPLSWFFCLLRHGSFHFVPCISPFFGSFGLFMIRHSFIIPGLPSPHLKSLFLSSLESRYRRERRPDLVKDSHPFPNGFG
jgi:hypothetical protein